ncbi:secretion protein HlyD family protein [Hydrogenobacter thermophilus TK-6]|uniref:Multidrug resistance efflux pump n=1 Tax=Hydrogenobacter thermophilus (strain DSM 6534 / IAM 12695 / TK-6) TaxID=608538 RepID=D3DF93_HYDTT|nr:HlyD family efflux transporter periplasmic adaptor subunit [Hydrogenobacter thermophilus]ADO44439.1 secretion protein HlyD family protein [Hydrogenobacter thermophilus TK-6]BAI68495.1 multidrug resistance efflux pump [Hydrogenobacter thermophilus TK-6]
MKRKVGLTIVISLMMVFSVIAFRWIKHRMEYAVTDAVFVKADQLSNVGFQKVSGRVIKLYKDLGDEVKKSEVIAEIDPTDYQLNLQNIRAKIESLEAQKEQLLTQLTRVSQELSVNYSMSDISAKEVKKREQALEKQLSQVQAQLELAQKDRERYKNLLERGVIPRRTFEEADTRYKVLKDQEESLLKSLEELRLSYKKSLENVSLSRIAFLKQKELKAQVEALEKEIESLKKQEELAQNYLSNTKLTAPFDGVVAKRYVSVGDVVSPGSPVYAIVKPDSMYVEVLLEESKLRGVQKGCKAYVRLDAYPNKVFEGVVEEISPASAATFALVPRDISAGEFTKVVQRIPVKIRIIKGDASLLRVGMGGEVEIKRVR